MPKRAGRSKQVDARGLPARDAVPTSSPTRKLHLNVPEEIHQRLRVKCALDGCTMQDFVSRLIAEAVGDVLLVSRGEKGAVFSLTALRRRKQTP